jgi:tRNA A37 threonylcarbamoyladenosine modification protein TsaB
MQFEPGESFPGLKKQDLSADITYDAGDLIYLGREKLASDRADDLSMLEPLYVQKSQAEIKFELRDKS